MLIVILLLHTVATPFAMDGAAIEIAHGVSESGAHMGA